MENSAAQIQCSNPNCQRFNPQLAKCCHKCGTPIVKRYLWVVGKEITSGQVGELLGNRYFVKQPQVVLDTKPGLPPEVLEDIPATIIPYLRLFPYRLHLPQVYSYLPQQKSWLLEYGTVPLNAAGELCYPQFLPELTQIWPEETALTQLNWLWQMVKLWQPLQQQRAASSLLNPSLLRLNGALVQILELQFDRSDQTPSLKQLGELWGKWAELASPKIRSFLLEICQYLQQGRISSPEHLLAVLDQGICQCGQLYQHTYEIVTCTDTGSSRANNEDACYPPTNRLIKAGGGTDTLTIVCDGLGGMDKGEVASQMAIDILSRELSQLSFKQETGESKVKEKGVSEAITQALEKATYVANDAISQCNDTEGRHERRRMGTTLVMALAYGQEMYLTHIGDSRIYLVTPTTCHQVTVDDNLAVREVRLGYSLYRDVSRYPGAGSLIQALGISASASLHPTVQRLVLDRDCLFLLCSDGLSDFDRVEQYWESELVPILHNRMDVSTAAERLLDVAKEQNGHDNITIALVYCQVQPTKSNNNTVTLPDLESFLPDEANSPSVEETNIQTPSQGMAQELPPTKQKFSKLSLLVIALGLLGILAGGYLLFPLIRQQFDLSQSSSSDFSDGSQLPTLSVGDVFTLPETINVYLNLNSSDKRLQAKRIPQGSIVQVIESQDGDFGLSLQVCQLPQTATDNPESLTSFALMSEGERGWIEGRKVAQSLGPNWQPTSNQLSQCVELNPEQSDK